MLVLDTNIPSHAMLTISKMAKWIYSVSGHSIVGPGGQTIWIVYILFILGKMDWIWGFKSVATLKVHPAQSIS